MLGHKHILFGSDAPITNPIQIEIDKINSLPIKNELKQDIFCNNTFELLKRI
jgi:predicted TIM-barrel fold metal-dependent hydrolase